MIHNTKSFLLCIGLLFLVGMQSNAQVAKSTAAIYPSPLTIPGTKKWVYATGAYGYSSPAISLDGTIYVGADDNLCAIKANGTKKWVFTTRDSIFSSPAIGSDGTIYVGSYDKNLYAINPDGTQKWAFATKDSFYYSSPAIGSDGTIFVGSNNNLYAINPDGTQKWTFATEKIVDSSPAIGSDGTIYVGSWYGHLYAINPDGTQKWACWIGTEMSHEVGSPAIGSDGTIYVGTQHGYLYAINPDGIKKWEIATGYSTYSSPAIGSDGTIYVGSNDKKLHAINPNGTRKWAFATGNTVNSSPAIGSDGTIYVGSNDMNLYAINPDGTQKWVFAMENYVNSSPAIGSDGTIYVVLAYDLYAVYTSSLGLADSAWPMFHHDISHTGSIANVTPVTTTVLSTTSSTPSKTTSVEPANTTTSVPVNTTTSSVTKTCPAVMMYGNDSEQVATLREFRDTVLRNSQRGTEYVNLFYKHVFELTLIIINNPDIAAETHTTLDLLLPHIKTVLQGNEIAINEAEVKQINSVLDKISREAGLDLRTAIQGIQNALNRGKLFEELKIRVESTGK